MRGMESSVLISSERIAERVAQLGAEISRWAKTSAAARAGVGGAGQSGAPLALLWIADGAFIFAADLARSIDVLMTVCSLRASSYGAAVKSSGRVVFDADLSNFAGKKVLLVDDIFDTGRTLAEISAALRSAGVVELKTCVLLRKGLDGSRGGGYAAPDFVGFEIPDKFVFGYGLDYEYKFRNLRDIMSLERA